MGLSLIFLSMAFLYHIAYTLKVFISILIAVPPPITPFLLVNNCLWDGPLFVCGNATYIALPEVIKVCAA